MGAETPLEDWAALVKSLEERLSTCLEVTKHDKGGHREASALAHAFADLQESFGKFMKDQLPRLTQNQLDSSEIYDLLHDIGEEFRHILYHIKDPKFYHYLHQENDD